MAECYRRLGEFDRAVEVFEELAEAHRDDEVVLTGLGDAWRGMGDSDRALDAWRRVEAIRPDNVFVLGRIADAHRHTGDLTEAATRYLRILRLDSTDVPALRGLALILATETEVDIADVWLVRVARFVLEDQGPVAARAVLDHLSEDSTVTLDPELEALLAPD